MFPYLNIVRPAGAAGAIGTRMAGAGSSDVKLEKSVRRFREKFHGHVSVKKANVLMERYDHNHDFVSSWLVKQVKELGSENEDVYQADSDVQDQQNILKDRDIEEVAATMNLPLTEKNLRMLDDAQKGHISKEDCQFACRACDNMWWRRVPERKKVSRCRKCWVKYEPVPKDKMWGKAEFQCLQCGHTFTGFAQMGTPSPCYHCGNSVLPNRILPPRRPQNERGRKNTHTCFAEDCYNRQGSYTPGTSCVHPKSRKQKNMPIVLFPSAVHESSGSTVATCLSQGSLLQDLDDLILEDLKEEAEEEEGN
ncbi:shiftless antiviral inhibitor of ribosomal frameshifting protein isoform X2 [Dromiciops gliroides]|uniref:shiftless antiviral inhibitor of ribosomal frameshifting protein isoform X2 n=1 Tax=Dromiciops gliroides TaxID=33562 RepID=UPI001CC5E96F|nr:shiftless antiviral inhibitor of ribosomal frameshifting protein isoform X2 [Dromiciops gliroides]